MIRIIDAPDAAPSLFPEQHISEFLSYVRSVWTELKAKNPVWWDHERETKLVEGFFYELKNDERRMTAGVGFGSLILEGVDVILDADGMPKQRGRTDIRFAYAVDFGPELVLEFKRLDTRSHLRQEYVKSGLCRFSTGKYSPESDFGIMVGLVAGSAADEKRMLLTYLRRRQTQERVASRQFDDPASIPELDFGTHHDRPNCLSTTICVGHLLLER
ncbi:hypothetical protein WYI_23615 [Ochrobactrum sp. CDB2]|nr:hypothetical protein WYI_23615 [Ochrobactrum sp. CDB2]